MRNEKRIMFRMFNNGVKMKKLALTLVLFLTVLVAFAQVVRVEFFNSTKKDIKSISYFAGNAEQRDNDCLYYNYTGIKISAGNSETVYINPYGRKFLKFRIYYKNGKVQYINYLLKDDDTYILIDIVNKERVVK